MTRDRLMELAEAWVRAGKRARAAEIDAGCCGTSADFRKARERATEEADAEEAFTRALDFLPR